jgi:hypothetical protein
MEILFLISVLVFVAIYAAYREWLNAAHRRWLGELDLYKKRLSAYEELKRAVGPLRARGFHPPSRRQKRARHDPACRRFVVYLAALAGAPADSSSSAPKTAPAEPATPKALA